MTTAAPALPWVLQARQVSKRYGGTTALAGVDFGVAPGSVHALIGENGAGKSTLVKILSGIERPTGGQLLLDGRPITFTSAGHAAAHGVAVVHQELPLFPDLSVAENMFMGREQLRRWRTIDRRGQEEAARAVLETLGQHLDPRLPVGMLPLGIRQMVEIGRALLQQARVLLMDEPTSALSPREVSTLFRVIGELSARGVGIVYISHRLQELLEVADSVTILRDGRLVDSAPVAEMSVDRIVSRMTGRTSPLRAGPSEAAAEAPVVLETRNLTLAARPGRVPLRGITFDLRAGELLGVYGAMGAGRTELLESLIGIHADAGGSLMLGSKRLDGLGVAERVSAGLAFVPEDRQASGLVPTLSVEQNMSLSSLHLLGTAGWVSTSRERCAAARWAADLKVKAPALNAPVTALSGGNQQKVIIARGLMRHPRVLLMDEPTRGVDVAARADIVDCMRRIAATGVAVMFSSSDLNELLAASTRVLVLSKGWLTEECASRDATEAAVAAAASRGPNPGMGTADAPH